MRVMKYLFCLSLMIGLSSSTLPAQQPKITPIKSPEFMLVQAEPAAKPVVKHPRGYVAPKDIKERIAKSWDRHGHHLRAMPHVGVGASVTDYDARALGICTPIKDQKQCGSCWDFGGTELCESAIIKAGAMSLAKCVLSPQYTLDCYQNGGCDGDNSQTVTDHAKSVGLPLEADYGPYTASPGQCKSGVTLYKIADSGYVSQNQIASFQELMDACVKYGVIQVNLDAGCLDNYNGGVITTGDGSSVDHAVLMEGFHCERNADGSINNDKSYLIIRNSWNESWGEKGRFRIKPGIWSIGDGALWAVVQGGPVPPPGPTPPTPPVPPTPPSPTPTNVVIQVPGGSVTLTGTFTPTALSNTVDLTGLLDNEIAAVKAFVEAMKTKKKCCGQ